MDKTVEYVKCLKDKTRQYFIEHYLSTFNADERREVAFKLFPRQIEFLKSLVNNSNTIAIKHRQAGITTVTSAWATGQMVFASKKAPETVLCIGNKLDISQQLIEKMGAFLDQVPRWMWGPEFWSPDPKSEKNTKSIYKVRNKDRIELFNGCKIYARSSGRNAARGISAVSILIFDEAAFIEEGLLVYSQAVAATASVSDAKIVMVSTPNGKDQLYYNTYNKALKGENNYHPVEFKWFQDPRYNRNLRWSKKDQESGEVEIQYDPVIDARGTIEYNEERWRKLEREGWIPTSPWYEDMCKTFNHDELRIEQELNVSFLGSADNVVPPEVIEMHDTQNVIQITEDWPLKDPLVPDTWIWKQPIAEHRYICSVDASSGASDDRTAIEVFDVDAIDEKGMPCIEQVLEYNGKKTGDEIAGMVFQYAHTYNTALVVVEAIGGYGDAVLLQLMSMRYPNLYYDDPALKDYTIQEKYAKFNLQIDDKLPGFHTSNLRFQMINNFVIMLKNNSFRVRSKRVISELETWVFKNGRPDHMDGMHDDCLTCLAMGLFVMEFSMLRREGNKRKDAAIASSWMTTHNAKPTYSNGMYDATTYTNNSFNIAPSPNSTPSMFQSIRQNEQSRRQKAMIMLTMGSIYKNKQKPF